MIVNVCQAGLICTQISHKYLFFENFYSYDSYVVENITDIIQCIQYISLVDRELVDSFYTKIIYITECNIFY